MTDDPRSNGSRLSLADVVDMLREDSAAAELRGQRGRDELEGRLMAAIQKVSSDLGTYIGVHGGEHLTQRTSTETAHKRFDDFIQANAVVQARRDGALGVTRFIAETLGRNWKGLLAIAGAIAALSGAIHVDLAVR